MYLNQVEAFVHVAKTQSFSQAARRLYVSQPTVSAHIKALECELETQLFIRSTKDVVLSEAGELFYQYAIQLLKDRDDAKSAIQMYNKKLTSIIHLGFTELSVQHIIPQILPNLLKRHPGIQIFVHEMTHAAVLKELKDSTIDFGISWLPAPENNYISVPIGEDPLILVTPNNALFRHFNGVFPIEKLLDYPLVLENPEHLSRKYLDNYLQSISKSCSNLQIIAQFPSTAGVLNAVQCGCGISIVSRLAASDMIANGSLLEFPLDSSCHQQFYLIQAKKKISNLLFDDFSVLLQEQFH